MADQHIIQTVQQQLTPFFESLDPVIAVYLYGSILEQNTFHDVDLAVLCEKSFLKTEHYFHTVLRWGTLAESHLQPRFDVDLRLLNEAPVTFQHEVISKGHIVYERDHDARVMFEARVLSEYMDTEPLRKFFERSILSEGAS
ncbi:MAG: nucleotidyltransferase domain-containing protein [candidate division KSB1 bacterium]|nr:nucleotidyltransferase domain-containing protein [candidate division KSB1 bacterium]